MDNHQEISSAFNEVAQKYDVQRKKLIPCFDDFYGTATALASSNKKSPSILDLGAGTGLMSSFLLKKYPNASVTLIDLSEKMLDVAKTRLQSYPNVSYLIADYTNYIAKEQYDIIVSALSIHHLTDPQKLELYENTYNNLKDTGIFINADQVLGETAYLDSLYKSDWKNKVESSDLCDEEIESAYKRTKLDKMSNLEEQLKGLKNLGFSDVDCIYKYYNFVVLYGRKSYI
ncbi:class I SAM-dependent methyltransferase [Paenibacillus endoradicis]|uniref:class I SAM-dependent methyltransferase n=1 Tax=Paenibacillus endoradicis TaxID=2972487 RepID=UPI002158E8B6|nr:class I SAM-dependent methyltransferase [Paenibacillus endoradicis]MCR8659516.1 class I SAM-dependent methyltransferase [Paenibacillus endoradicis]